MWTAIGIGAASLLGGALGAKGAKGAAAEQGIATRQQILEQARQYDDTKAMQAPFVETGTLANARLRTLLGLGDPNAEARTSAATAAGIKPPTMDQARQIYMDFHQKKYGGATPDPTGMIPQTQAIFEQLQNDYQSKLAGMGPQGTGGATPDSSYGFLTRRITDADIEGDPVYQKGLEFGATEGRNAINARAIAGGIPGGYDSGATLKALTRFGTDYGSTKAGESYNRFTADQGNIYNKLAGVSGAGQVATNAVQTAGTNAANATSQALGDAGNARAAGIVGGANAWGGALGGVANAAQNYQSNQQLMALLNRQRPAGYGRSPDYSGVGSGDNWY